jgi:hypothetical protein
MLGRRKPTRVNMIGQPKTQIIDSVVGEGGIYELERPRLQANIIEIFISQ